MASIKGTFKAKKIKYLYLIFDVFLNCPNSLSNTKN